MSISWPSNSRQRQRPQWWCRRQSSSLVLLWVVQAILILILLLTTTTTVHVSARATAATAPTKAASLASHTANVQIQPNNKNKGSTPTRVTGYGSHHPAQPVSETLLGRNHPSRNRTTTSTTTSSTTTPLWIRPTNSSSLDLYSATHHCTVQVSAVSNADADGSENHDSGSTLRSIVLDEINQRSSTNTSTSTDDGESWIPVEGLYGMYSIPSGHLMVWIQGSSTVYEAPALPSSRNSSSSNNNRSSSPPCWWQIRKVTQLYICRLENPHQTTTRSQRREEKRQISLLRQAMKHHDWYYTAAGNALVPDMTHTLQRALAWRGSLPSAHDNNDDDDATNSATTKPTKWWQFATTVNNNNSTDAATAATTSPLCPDSRFFWNEGLVSALLQQQAANNDTADQILLDHVIPVTSAFCGVQSNLTTTSATGSIATAAGDKNSNASSLVYYDELLITRRSRFRAGTRFTKRGADQSGAVANYAETEQILLLWKQELAKSSGSSSNDRTLQSISSHVQTRGSIPLRWSSPTDIKTYRPRVRIGTDPLAQARAVRQHLAEQAELYIPQHEPASSNATVPTMVQRKYPALVLLNLVDKKSDQGRLGRALDAVLKAVLDVYKEQPDPAMPWLQAADIQHIWFDFHAEVKHGRWEKLVGLLDQLKPTLVEQGYFCAQPVDGSSLCVTRLQTGVTRTNCMDCLDRTNVVQSIFGRFLLFSQFAADKSTRIPLAFKTAFRKHPMTIPWKEGEIAHRHLWADNADAISRLYAGTPALKGDFTRTGKRTKKGALDDGMNSLQRYYLNNFLDADRQEGMDLLVGHQPFSYLGDDLAGDDEGVETALSKASEDRTMTIEEAARQMFMGTWNSNKSENSRDDSDHVRIKVKPVPLGGLSSTRQKSRRSLDLRWLPGDLQTQVRSLASPSLNDLPEDISSQAALWAIDQRSASELPWWVTSGESSSSSSDSEDDGDQRSSVVADVGSAATNNAGYLLGAMVAGTQAPVTMAALVLGLASVVAFPHPKDDHS